MSIIEDDIDNKKIPETNDTPIVEKVETEVKENKNQNVIIEYNWSTPIATKDKDDPEKISLPSDFQSMIEKKIEETPNIQLVDNDASRGWVQVLRNGINYNSFNKVFESSLEKEGSDFKTDTIYIKPKLWNNINSDNNYSNLQNNNISYFNGLYIRIISDIDNQDQIRLILSHQVVKDKNDKPIYEKLILSDKVDLQFKTSFSINSGLLEKELSYKITGDDDIGDAADVDGDGE
jgi:hypothetical protein